MLNDTHEPYNEMHSAISSYTTAQVAPSDGIGYSNASLINMACRHDGRLLQPSAPARAIDASFALAGGPRNRVRNVHAVMATHSVLPLAAAVGAGVAATATWTHVLSIGLNDSFRLLPSHLAGEVTTGPALAWTGYQTSGSVGTRPANITLLGPFSAATPLVLPPCGYSDFGLHHIAPILPASQLAFLGEMGKWVPTAAGGTRVTAVGDAAAGLTVDIVGVPGEAVELAFAAAAAGPVATAVCTVGADGTAKAEFDGRKAKC